MLRNLNTLKHDLSTEISSRLEHVVDINLPPDVTDEILDLPIEFEVEGNVAKHITSTGNLVFAPAAWFYSAAKLQDFLTELLRYKRIVDDVAENSGLVEDYNGWTTEVKKQGAVSDRIKDYLRENHPEDMDLVVRFLEDYQWWGGGKAIGRTQGDFSHSALLSASGLLNESSGFVVKIAEAMRGRNSLVTRVISLVEDAEGGDPILKRRKYPLNRIVYGAPGTGKSYMLDKQSESQEQIRVTFHPDITYGQFVGSYKPVMSGEKISYSVVPGPFLHAILKANEEDGDGNPRKVVLIIEELNRANVSGVFGDLFQLLDRRPDGRSQFPIDLSSDLRKFLEERGMDLTGGFTIPSNLSIWASMNSADQGVFPLDSAFKRRWSMEYVGIDQGESAIKHKRMALNQTVEITWNDFRKSLNDYLITLSVNEDKLIGPFFLTGDELSSPNGFQGKLILYIWDDILRHKDRARLFKVKSLSIFTEKVNEAEELTSMFGDIFSESFMSFLENRDLFPTEEDESDQEAD